MRLLDRSYRLRAILDSTLIASTVHHLPPAADPRSIESVPFSVLPHSRPSLQQKLAVGRIRCCSTVRNDLRLTAYDDIHTALTMQLTSTKYINPSINTHADRISTPYPPSQLRILPPTIFSISIPPCLRSLTCLASTATPIRSRACFMAQDR